MLVYWVVFGLFCINAFMNNKSSKHMNLLIYVFFILVYSFRKNVGTDWVAYKYYFDNFSLIGDIGDYNFEIGYKLLNYVANLLFNSFWILVFVVGIFNGILFWKATNKYTKNIGIVMLLSLYYVFFPSLDIFRQSITMILFYFSLEYIEKDKKKYLLINLFGLLFHSSGIIALLFYAFNKNNKMRIFSIIVLIFLKEFETIYVQIFDLIPIINLKYNWYFNDIYKVDNSIFTLKLIEYTLMLIFYLFLIKKKKCINNREKIAFNLVFFGFLFQITIAQMSDIVYRMTYYTDIGMMLSYAFIYDRLRGSFYKYLYIVFLIIYISLRFSRIFPFYDPRFMYYF